MLQTKLFHGGAGALLEHAYYYLLQFAADHFLVPLSIGKDVEHYRGKRPDVSKELKRGKAITDTMVYLKNNTPLLYAFRDNNESYSRFPPNVEWPNAIACKS